jgi:hypothetical protein
LRVGSHLFLEGQGKEDKEWTSIAIEDVRIIGNATSITVNREYLTKTLKLGLNRIQMEDELTPIVCSKEGKTVVVMPVRLDAPAAVKTQAKPPIETSLQTNETNNERTNMPRTAATTENSNETKTESNAGESSIKTVVQQIERIKEALKNVLSDFGDVLTTLKQAEKEKKATEKEIESIRSTLRSLQRVQI